MTVDINCDRRNKFVNQHSDLFGGTREYIFLIILANLQYLQKKETTIISFKDILHHFAGFFITDVCLSSTSAWTIDLFTHIFQGA